LEQALHQTPSDDIFLLVVDHRRREHALPALPGWRVMEVIRDWGIDLSASCGGACACAGCHVYVDQPRIERLHPPTPEEEDRLDRTGLPLVLPDTDVAGYQRTPGAPCARLGIGVTHGEA
jgi:ferredoxin